jgi:hypothetical protein
MPEMESIQIQINMSIAARNTVMVRVFWGPRYQSEMNEGMNRPGTPKALIVKSKERDAFGEM